MGSSALASISPTPVTAVHANHGGLEAETARAQIWPSIKAGRAGINELYGVFSITPTPRHFVQAGQIAMPAGGHALLASDGLVRLVDVFRLYTALELSPQRAARDLHLSCDGFASIATYFVLEELATEHPVDTCRVDHDHRQDEHAGAPEEERQRFIRRGSVGCSLRTAARGTSRICISGGPSKSLAQFEQSPGERNEGLEGPHSAR